MSSITYGFILSILLIASSWIWLQFDPDQSVQRQAEKFWGEIYERENQVYINTGLQSFWQIARTRTSLSSQKTQVQTLHTAFLSILLQKKGRLEISENSNVIIHIPQNTKKRFICEIELIEGDMYMSFFGQKDHLCHLIWKGQKIAHLKNADITLTRNSSQLNIYTHRGLVTFPHSNQELSNGMWSKVGANGLQLFEDDFFVLTPLANDKVYQSQKGRVRFRWAHTPKNSQLQLFVGSKKHNLKPVWKTPPPTDKSQGYFRFPLGTYYWQLMATQNQKQYKSQVYKIFIRPELHPILVYPSLGSTKFVNSGKKEAYKFAWLNQSRLENLFIEISKDINFSSIVFKKPVGEFGFIEFSNIFPEGQYFWRVSGFRHNSSELLKSHTRHFFVTNKNTTFQKIKSWPRDREKVNRWDLYWKESKFIWNAFYGFQNVRISITDLHSQFVQYFPVDIGKNRFDIPLLDPGFYEWKLQGESQEGQNLWVDITGPKKITVIASPSIHWQKAIDRQLSWSLGPSHTDHYMLRIRQYQLLAGSKSSQVTIRKVRNNHWTVPPTFTNFFSIKVMAMDRNNQIIALSPEKDFVFSPLSASLQEPPSSLKTTRK